jgi:hypothetical protein
LTASVGGYLKLSSILADMLNKGDIGSRLPVILTSLRV